MILLHISQKRLQVIQTGYLLMEYPCMVAAAQDYLAIPALEVSCERAFGAGRDIIGLQRFSLHSNTMRQLSLLRASVCYSYVC
jgi:hypothetical protein